MGDYEGDGDQNPVEEENYFVSMTDMMVGMVFIFIILLMFFVIQFRRETDRLRGANETRAIIIEQIKERLTKAKVTGVSTDSDSGIIRLDENLLFEVGEWRLNKRGEDAIPVIARVLEDVLPCYTDNASGSPKPQGCMADRGHQIESLYIEGHADKQPFPPNGQIKDNLDLSAMRATNTYRALLESSSPMAGARGAPKLLALCSRRSPEVNCEPILSVSGYGATRLIDLEKDAPNRRIDLRIIMLQPGNGRVLSAAKEIEAKATERGLLK
jgi:chemotaxis protein MotB